MSLYRWKTWTLRWFDGIVDEFVHCRIESPSSSSHYVEEFVEVIWFCILYTLSFKLVIFQASQDGWSFTREGRRMSTDIDPLLPRSLGRHMKIAVSVLPATLFCFYNHS